ncbi:hypothetical protein BOTBODRAFT_31226 [Botryobasidium botryosum FD-172 SS1]|uniref:Glutathione synthetase n=1 Tax=Botryobasidium botryosum (strain FD-172 SS1) TaxID=930990 RepID=A0A067MKR8_BOTB1|nr:hypothetical protein BOTBODRAFT_31226 [Botryobasidium botryosum FD-172 SS1]
MTDTSPFIQWPPSLLPAEEDALTLLATTYALSHGLLYLPVPTSQPVPPAPPSAIHAPLTILPTPFPRHLFERVQRVQRVYSVLYARIAQDIPFLDRIMGEEGVAKVDDFVGPLWRGWKQLRDEGMAQPLQLGIYRSDYMLHAPPGSTDAISIKQVEFNTISSSFGSLSQLAAAMHRYMYASTQFFNTSKYFQSSNFPLNETTPGIARGIAEAHKAYSVKEAFVLFVVQEGERNVFDQRMIEYELLEKHSIHVVRLTFDETAERSVLDPTTKALKVKTDPYPDPIEISVVYYRAGYTPRDYPTPAQFATRVHIERSRAIKCPSIALQLAGGKKVQETLTHPGVLESFLLDRDRWGEEHVFDQADVDAVRETWVGMWGLDFNGNEGVRKAREGAAGLVLKPQREGGGNNVYTSDIPAFLDTLDLREREAWIAMEMILPPQDVQNYLMRAGMGERAILTDVVSELGIFGWALFGEGGQEKSRVKEQDAGWLLRTKGRDSNEGGVATGFSVLDSLLLVD